MAQVDLKNDAVEISADTYWVGRREGTLLERNIYLRVFKSGQKAVNVLVDPGPPEDLMALSKKVEKTIGNLRNVNLTFINHQDPDVAYNATYIQKMNPNMLVLCSEDTWRLIRFYGLSEKKYRPIEQFKSHTVTLQTGHALSFVPTPFCHFRGAVMLYDHETRILFSGDLFGGLSYVQDLYADKRYWDGLKAFHQIYMPIQEAISYAIGNIRKLDPPPLMIAPQHGSIITGEYVNYYLDRLESLPVGLNLLMASQEKDNFIAAMNELLLEITPIIGPEAVARTMKIFQADGSFPNVIFANSKGVSDIKIDLHAAIEIFAAEFIKSAPDKAGQIEVAVLKVLLGRNIPLPESMVGQASETPEIFDQ